MYERKYPFVNLKYENQSHGAFNSRITSYQYYLFTKTQYIMQPSMPTIIVETTRNDG